MAYNWDRPKGTTRWHLFRSFSYTSLCGKWSSGTHDEEEHSRGPLKAGKRDCKRCVREFNAIMSEAFGWRKT